MAMNGKKETKEIAGKKFIFQHPGLEATLDIRERAKDQNGNTSEKELYKEFLEHVVFVEEEGVPQRINIEYFEQFDSMKVFTEVMRTASKFIFR
ncbi:hypothetical protein FC756_16035 [Lysinibacillus mangiferihumi]|uniref:Uncharacterized protein n=1 Tax=Lysinibacillus mangiferihumi TaxID=1130819 RepID=A0A4U2YVL3_9BACI|nr:hypothetical protein [Lysinibacillus mangiferihumi]TKI65559.1 hypothetical protein FC756_16035 [Lysinibacillus mangiferihumi]